MVSQDILIINRLGLHARAAAQLVRLANEYPCEIHIDKAGQVSDTKSVMQVLMLGGTEGSSLKVIANGDREEEALKAVADLFAARFNELE